LLPGKGLKQKNHFLQCFNGPGIHREKKTWGQRSATGQKKIGSVGSGNKNSRIQSRLSSIPSVGPTDTTGPLYDISAVHLHNITKIYLAPLLNSAKRPGESNCRIIKEGYPSKPSFWATVNSNTNKRLIGPNINHMIFKVPYYYNAPPLSRKMVFFCQELFILLNPQINPNPLS